MRVVTLLPAATEIVAAVGGAEHLVGISHECDYPAAVQRLPRVTVSSINPRVSGAVIDAKVRRLRDSGLPVIGIDAEQLQKLRPDLIITQELCEVCAVADGEAHRLSAAIHPSPTVLSLAARDLAGIWRDIREVGAALGLEGEAEELIVGLKVRMRRLSSVRPATRPQVLCVEWLDPLYLGGHWVPELITAAGGDDIGAFPGSHSARREWGEMSELRPDHVVVMLCGFGIERARAELDAMTNPEALDLLRRVPTWIIDGNQYTSRPGPRVVDGAERIQAAISGCTGEEVERWRPAAHS